MSYSTSYRSSYPTPAEPAGYGFSTPTKGGYSPSVRGPSAGSRRYYDSLGPSTESATPVSARGTRYSAEGYYGLTPSPSSSSQRPMTSSGGSPGAQRRAMTPSTRSWETTPSPQPTYSSSSLGRSTFGATNYGSPVGVRKNLSSELSLSQERYSSRNHTASLYPTSNTATVTTPQNLHHQPTTAYFTQKSLAESSLSGSVSPRTSYPQQESSTASPGFRRAPSMNKTGYAFLPPADASDRHKPLVVLDLDETLVYARSGPINVRPGVTELLATLHGRAEVAVWTAGERDYAQSVIQRIDHNHTIKHCVYRHPKWWSGRAGYSKDLTLLGRNMDKIILIDNTPDCLKSQPFNGLLVEDFTGRADHELTGVTQTLDYILTANASESIPDIMAQCPHVCRRRIPLDGYGQADLWTLTSSSGDYSPGRGSRMNRDAPRSSSSSRVGASGTGYWARF